MPLTETPPELGRTGQPCGECGSQLAADQRYCLNCGTRRGGPRLPYEDAMAVKGAPAPASGVVGIPPHGPALAGPAGPPPRDVSPFAAVAAVAVLGGILLIGVLLGRGADSNQVSQAPSVVRVEDGAGAETAAAGADDGTSQTAANTQVTSDWPSGKTGFTIELGTLPKAGTDATAVDAQKAQLTSQGATDVGALDSDLYASLPAGNYVLYSGVFDTKGEATKALGKLKADFPDARVVQISENQVSSKPVGETVDSLDPEATGGAPVTATDEALEELGNQSGGDYSEASENLPDVIATEGEPPPVDNGPSGGGSGAGTVIK